MKLLFITQAIDTSDPVLSVYANWVHELAKHYERVEVICLKKGMYQLPDNVRVHSLGKEQGGVQSFVYAYRFLKLIWKLRREYTVVFVHMNQEYILLGGVLWQILNKRIYFWYNHYAGSAITDLAAMFCKKVFCTSKHSYTAKYARTKLMPVGVDISQFVSSGAARTPHSILFLARIAPSKRLELLLEACSALDLARVQYAVTIVGSPLHEDQGYYESMIAKSRTLLGNISFVDGIPHKETPGLYLSHEVFVNCSKSGMFDKTLFEAAAGGCFVLATSDDFRDAAGDQHYFTSPTELAQQLILAFGRNEDERTRDTVRMIGLARSENLATLADQLHSLVV